jgi:cellulose synthase/poly-beta-1,6-N-acetylglucosamine synthase-like glycosyltransferase
MILAVVYFVIFFWVYGVVLLRVVLSRHRPPAPFPDTPMVSILIAVRNEEANIIRCLEAVARLQYPPEKIEVLLGDDASTDETAAQIQSFIRDKPGFRYHYIGNRLGRAQGKANVLAQLTRAATSDYFFITDADTALPDNWIRQMLAPLKPDTGIVTGITTIAGSALFARMQALDWINVLGMMQVLSDMDMPVSTMGNNMMVTRKAYEATGGYESLPFSLTEDVQLFQEVLRRGFGVKNIFDAGVLAVSLPAPSWPALWQQRKRWMGGLRYLPWYMLVMVSLYGAFYPLSLVLAYSYSWPLAAAVFLAKVTLQTAFIHRCLRRLGLRLPTGVLFLFEFYLIFASLITFLFFLLPGKIIWKDRKY